MLKRMHVSVIAGAVAAAFAGQAGATNIYGAGASAVANTVKKIILNDYCAAGSISYYDNDTKLAQGGSVYVISCTLGANPSHLSSNPTISIDTSGGSWKGLLAVNSALYNAQLITNAPQNTYPVATINTSTCAAPSSVNLTIIGTTYPVTYYGSCSTMPVPSQPTVGFTDVETALFNNSSENQPLQNNTWNTGAVPLISPWPAAESEYSGYPVTMFGLTFGVAASANLYADLQADQIAGGTIPSACSGHVETSTNPTYVGCAPSITRTQYRNLVNNNPSNLNTNDAELFFHTTPPHGNTIVIARRDRGSGSQASSNATFLGSGCTGGQESPQLTASLPADQYSNYYVMYNFTTGAVVSAITGGVTGANGQASGTTLTNVIGVISQDNESKLTGGAGFLRLDGQYPSNVNVANGVYNYVVPEQLHCSSSASGDALQFCQDLAGISGLTSVSSLTYTGTGVVPLASAVAAGTTFPIAFGTTPTTTFFTVGAPGTNAGDFCTGPRAY